MATDGFLSRWSRRKVEARDKQALPAAVPPLDPPLATDAPALQAPAEQPVAAEAKPQLTMDDVAALTHDSDYSAFVARGVDENVKRSALKKLFTDPHFNVMDGLDTYIDDYSKFEPIPPEMLATLNHAKSLLDPLAQLGKPVMPVAENSDGPEQPIAEADQQAIDDAELTASAATEDPADASAEVEQSSEPGEADDAAPEATDPEKLPQART